MSSSLLPALTALGFDRFFQSHFSDSLDSIARVAVEHRGRYVVLTANGATDAVVAGRLRHAALDALDLPRVGDWVALARDSPAELRVIERVLPRRTVFVRRSSGDGDEPQVIAANVDCVLIVSALSASEDERVRRRGLNLRRLERYWTAVRQSGARAIFVLNKCDLAEPREALAIPGAEVIATSAVTGVGLDVLRGALEPNETIALVGSSGVGKSALANRLLGRELETVCDVREDDERGRHTTTHRELFLRAEGGTLIDTPGMRELGLWSSESESAGFEEIDNLARGCRFRDCRHAGEPGCAVIGAIERGELELERLSSSQKLERELAFERRKRDPEARRQSLQKVRQRAREYRRRDKLGKGGL